VLLTETTGGEEWNSDIYNAGLELPEKREKERKGKDEMHKYTKKARLKPTTPTRECNIQ